MDLKFPSTNSLICQYFRKGYCQAISEKPLACFTLDIETWRQKWKKIRSWHLHRLKNSFQSKSESVRWLENDRYIGLPIFKHFTIIGYRFWKKPITDIYIYIYILFFCHIHNYTEYNQQWNVFSVFDPSKSTHTHTLGAVETHTHTHTHTHTPGAVDTVHSGEAPVRPPHVIYTRFTCL